MIRHPLTKTLAALEWSQGELARRSKVCQSTISFALSGKRSRRFSPQAAKQILEAIEAETASRRLTDVERRRIGRLTLSDLVFPPANRRARAA